MANLTDQMLQYIRSIRNQHKRDYATRYAIWLMRSDADIVEPQAFHLSYMGAQAVRMRLHEISGFYRKVKRPEGK